MHRTRTRGWAAGPALLLALAACDTGAGAALPAGWPPVVGQPFPALNLRDHRGEPFDWSSLRGKVVLVEPIGMPCRGCVALCGGHDYGAFDDVEPQQDLPSLERMFPRFTDGQSLTDQRITVVQVLLFSHAMGTPTVDGAARWHAHFRLDKKPNHLVLVGTDALREVTRQRIPGYWLVDKDGVLRSDAAGNGAPENLYSDTLPMVPELLDAAASPR